jgi:hypothetical protein
MLKASHTDTIIDHLSDGGQESRAKKALRRYRRDQTRAREAAALKHLSALGKDKQRELRSAAAF